MAEVSNKKAVFGATLVAVMAFMLGLGAYHTIIRPFQKPDIVTIERERVVYRDVKPAVVDSVPEWNLDDTEYETTPIQVTNRYVLLDTTFVDIGRLCTILDLKTMAYPVVSFEPFPVQSPVIKQKVFLPRGFFRSREFGFLIGVGVAMGIAFATSG